jgi:CRP-like cAMP-binding protein
MVTNLADEPTATRALDRFLGGIELFGELDEGELRRLASEFRETHYARDAVVFRHGEAPAGLYVLRTGTVALFRDEVGKPLQLLARYTAGDFFGELGLFDGSLRQATARVSEPGYLLEIPRPRLLEFLNDHPNLALRLHMAAARRHTENVAAVLGLGPRDEVRIRVDRPVRMHGPDGGARYVVLENLSQGGLSLRGAPTQWQPPTSVRFALELDGELLEIHGRIAWRSGETLGLAFETRSSNLDVQIQRALRWLVHRDTPSPAAKDT